MDSTMKLIGRIAIAGLFAWAAIREIMNPSQIMNGIKSAGLPGPGLFFAIALIILIACSAMVILGYQARWGALGLLVFYAVAYLVLRIDLGGGEYGPLLKNLAVAGGLLYIYAAGPGAMTIKKG